MSAFTACVQTFLNEMNLEAFVRKPILLLSILFRGSCAQYYLYKALVIRDLKCETHIAVTHDAFVSNFLEDTPVSELPSYTVAFCLFSVKIQLFCTILSCQRKNTSIITRKYDESSWEFCAGILVNCVLFKSSFCHFNLHHLKTNAYLKNLFRFASNKEEFLAKALNARYRGPTTPECRTRSTPNWVHSGNWWACSVKNRCTAYGTTTSVTCAGAWPFAPCYGRSM